MMFIVIYSIVFCSGLVGMGCTCSRLWKGMCEVCTEAVHCVALWTRVTLRCGHVCSMYRGSPLRSTLNTGYIKVRTCVQYVPRQSIAWHFQHGLHEGADMCGSMYQRRNVSLRKTWIKSQAQHDEKSETTKIAVSLRSSTANVGLCGYILPTFGWFVWFSCR